jgi:PTS system mannose-specific IID component
MTRELPLTTRAAILLRMFSIQGSWNYEILLGNGIGFCVEPALRLLPGGVGGPAYRAALARQSRYFNAHPYLAAVAVGALARAELDLEDPQRIERFRTALCGPLGSVGDQLVWARWLPFCSLVALFGFGAGKSPLVVVGAFLLLYNAGHIGIRVWGFRTGWKQGLRVATALGSPVLRQAPTFLGRLAAWIAGFALPMIVTSLLAPDRTAIVGTGVAAVGGAVLIARIPRKADGWRLALIVLAGFALYAVSR